MYPGVLKNYLSATEVTKASYEATNFVKKQDRSKTCFNTAVKNWFLLDRKMKGEGDWGEPKKGYKG